MDLGNKMELMKLDLEVKKLDLQLIQQEVELLRVKLDLIKFYKKDCCSKFVKTRSYLEQIMDTFNNSSLTVKLVKDDLKII